MAKIRKNEVAPILGYAPDSVSVDGSCRPNPGLMEYRCVDNDSSEELFRVGPIPNGTNNVAEFLALVHVLALLKQQGRTRTTVYSDSVTAIEWVLEGKCFTNRSRFSPDDQVLDLVIRADKWLAENRITNRILKWKTRDWGQIPRILTESLSVKKNRLYICTKYSNYDHINSP